MSGLHIGVDPGRNGGVVALDGDGKVILADRMPATDADIWLLFESLALQDALDHNIHCVIEKVWIMPKQSVTSGRTFMIGYGGLLMALCGNGIPYTEVVPRTWQTAMGCFNADAKNVKQTKTQKKNANRDVAQRLFPELKMTLAIADAALLAAYCRKVNS